MADLTPEALAAELERGAADLDALSRKQESLADKPHWNRIRGRVASLRYSANRVRELTPAHAALAAERDQLAAKLAHALAANQRWAETLADLAPVRRQQTAPTAATRREGGRDHRAQS